MFVVRDLRKLVQNFCGWRTLRVVRTERCIAAVGGWRGCRLLGRRRHCRRTASRCRVRGGLSGGRAVKLIKNAIPSVATLLPLTAVRLTGGPLKKAQEQGLANQLKLEPDRMMFYMRQLAGLPTKAQTGYGSWDGPGRNLTGH